MSLARPKRLMSLKKLLGVKPKRPTVEELDRAKADHDEALRLTGGSDGD